MSNTFSALKFEIIEVGGNDGTWGPIVNTNVGTAIEQAIVGMATLDSADFTTNVCTLTLTNTNAAQDARAACLNITATLSAAGTLNVPAIQKPYIILNNSVGGFAVTVKVSGLTGVAIPAGKACVVYNNGTDVVEAINYLSSLTLGTDLAITDGGTGASTASGARTNLGATTLGANLFTITNPSAVTFPQFNADNTVSALDASSFRTAIGAGTGAGSVTSVSGTGTVNGITLTGTVTSTGNLTLGGTLSGVNLASQVTGTLPIANGGTGTTSTTFANLTTNVTGTLPVANGGTGVTTSTGTGNTVLSESPTFTGTPLAPTASTGTNTTQIATTAFVQNQIGAISAGVTSFSAGTTGLTPASSTSGAITLAGTLAVANGGTGITSLGTGVATFLGTPSSDNLRAAVTDETGTGALVFATSPTLVSPFLGTPQSGNFGVGTFTWPTFNQNTTGTAASTPLLQTTNFSISEVGGKLVFKYGATTIASMDSSGNLTTIANVTAYGTP